MTPEQMQQTFAGGNGARGGLPGAAGANANGTGRFQGGNAVSGSIISADATSITVKTADGSTKIVLLSGSTPISKVAEGTMADLLAGQNVIVTGTTNDDGTVTATRIQVGVNLGTPGSTSTTAGQ